MSTLATDLYINIKGPKQMNRNQYLVRSALGTDLRRFEAADDETAFDSMDHAFHSPPNAFIYRVISRGNAETLTRLTHPRDREIGQVYNGKVWHREDAAIQILIDFRNEVKDWKTWKGSDHALSGILAAGQAITIGALVDANRPELMAFYVEVTTQYRLRRKETATKEEEEVTKEEEEASK